MIHIWPFSRLHPDFHQFSHLSRMNVRRFFVVEGELDSSSFSVTLSIVMDGFFLHYSKQSHLKQEFLNFFLLCSGVARVDQGQFGLGERWSCR